MSKHKPGLAEWLKEGWTVGQYTPTENFKAINNHACVCRRGDMGLIAITGPADDRESQKVADLFAAAPELKACLERAIQYFHDNGGHESYTWLAWMEQAIAKAEGKNQ